MNNNNVNFKNVRSRLSSKKNQMFEAADQLDLVAIKIMDKKSLNRIDNGATNLIQEVRVHWALEECDSLLRLLEVFEDEDFVYLVLEYQKQGSLLGQIL